MITSYSFGRIEIDGREFRKDLVILTDGSIHHPWWRKSGHRLCLDDLDLILDEIPAILIIGTGAYGIMRPEPDLTSKLKDLGISVRAMTTKKAIEEYNSLLMQEEKVAGCFHLTC